MGGGDNWFATHQHAQQIYVPGRSAVQLASVGLSLAYLLRQKYWQMASLSLLSITNTPFKVLRQVFSIPGHFSTSPFASSSPSGRLQYCHSALPGSAFGAAGRNTPDSWGSSTGVLGVVASFLLSCLCGICSFCIWDGDPTDEGRRRRRWAGGNVFCLGMLFLVMAERSVSEPWANTGEHTWGRWQSMN